ncbi:hypothetical protein [Blautia sp. MSJ-19]|uniref:hypothetical protein n=1 Tax=Blautia sp. MSJ-19 TaxID=2841517 RepID=UPI001C0F1DED|nr:hypothetical protein [Blautia sp. MSJ-19]MBU5479980.1 hypothetical protein [Blautia sp. MSJ-19]
MEKVKQHLWSKNRGKIKYGKVGAIMAMLLLICEIRTSVYAMEFGGFDVSTGIGEAGGDWSDWDEEPSYEPSGQEQENSYNIMQQENDQDMQENVQEPYQSGRESFSNSGGTENSQETASWNEDGETEITGSYSWIDPGEDRRQEKNKREYRKERELEIMEENPEVLFPTLTPTPVPTPVAEPTVPPTPVFTEVPEQEEHTVTEYSEEYRLPPTECLHKRKLCYQKYEIGRGEMFELYFNEKKIPEVLSVRVNGQERAWSMEENRLKTEGLTEKDNKLELLLVIPEDLTWTEIQKNVILSYKVF